MRTVLNLITTAVLAVGQGTTALAAAEFSYAVKFVCGTFLDEGIPDPDEGALDPVLPGVYLSAISVGNPNEQKVQFSYDVAFTLGNVAFSRVEEEIDPRDARRLDCDFLFDNLGDNEFVKGILYLLAEQRLDIWAFYTAREFGAGDQISIDSVQVSGRRLDGDIAGRLGE